MRRRTRSDQIDMDNDGLVALFIRQHEQESLRDRGAHSAQDVRSTQMLADCRRYGRPLDIAPDNHRRSGTARAAVRPNSRVT